MAAAGKCQRGCIRGTTLRVATAVSHDTETPRPAVTNYSASKDELGLGVRQQLGAIPSLMSKALFSSKK